MLKWIWKRRPQRRAAIVRVRPRLESLEERAVPASLQPGLLADGPVGPAVTTVYTESNNPAAGQNAVLAFREDANGALTEIGSFNTGGTGQLDLPNNAVIGPDASSQEVVAAPNGRLLFAVNQGSNSISSFRIDPNGGLDLIGTFASGGVQPDSIGLAGDKLYVSNRGDSALGRPGAVVPNITGFRIEGDGSLTPIPGSTVTFPVDTSPSQNLITPNGKLLFAEIFGVPGSTAPQSNTFAPFQIDGNGSLDLAPGGNVGAPVTPPLLLGSAFNPNQPIIYAGLPGVDAVGVFIYDRSGQLTFVGDAPLQDGGAAPCWCAVSPDGRYLYTGNTASDSVGVFSLADPLHPVQIQNLALGGPLAPPGSPSGTLQTNVFQIALSPDGRTLYAIGQNTDATGAFANGNQLHILNVAADGTLSEPNGPILLSTAGVPGDAHPQGIAVVAGRGRGGSESDRTNALDAVFSTGADSVGSPNALSSATRIDFGRGQESGPDSGGSGRGGSESGRTNGVDAFFSTDADSVGSPNGLSSATSIDPGISDVVNALLDLGPQSDSAG